MFSTIKKPPQGGIGERSEPSRPAAGLVSCTTTLTAHNPNAGNVSAGPLFTRVPADGASSEPGINVARVGITLGRFSQCH